MSKDPRTNPFLDFFTSQGIKFIDYDENGEPLVDEELTLCESCQCMTRTLKKDNTCLKCGAVKGGQDED